MITRFDYFSIFNALEIFTEFFLKRRVVEWVCFLLQNEPRKYFIENSVNSWNNRISSHTVLILLNLTHSYQLTFCEITFDVIDLAARNVRSACTITQEGINWIKLVWRYSERALNCAQRMVSLGFPLCFTWTRSAEILFESLCCL